MTLEYSVGWVTPEAMEVLKRNFTVDPMALHKMFNLLCAECAIEAAKAKGLICQHSSKRS